MKLVFFLCVLCDNFAYFAVKYSLFNRKVRKVQIWCVSASVKMQKLIFRVCMKIGASFSFVRYSYLTIF